MLGWEQMSLWLYVVHISLMNRPNPLTLLSSATVHHLESLMQRMARVLPTHILCLLSGSWLMEVLCSVWWIRQSMRSATCHRRTKVLRSGGFRIKDGNNSYDHRRKRSGHRLNARKVSWEISSYLLIKKPNPIVWRIRDYREYHRKYRHFHNNMQIFTRIFVYCNNLSICSQALLICPNPYKSDAPSISIHLNNSMILLYLFFA